jgi:hypothetical protein
MAAQRVVHSGSRAELTGTNGLGCKHSFPGSQYALVRRRRAAVELDERAGRPRLTFLRRVKFVSKTSLPFSVSLARSGQREHPSTTGLSNLWSYTTSYPQLKIQWGKLPEELGCLGIYYP